MCNTQYWDILHFIHDVCDTFPTPAACCRIGISLHFVLFCRHSLNSRYLLWIVSVNRRIAHLLIILSSATIAFFFHLTTTTDLSLGRNAPSASPNTLLLISSLPSEFLWTLKHLDHCNILVAPLVDGPLRQRCIYC